MPPDPKKLEGGRSEEDEHGAGLAKTFRELEGNIPNEEDEAG